jgi:hypothetical protein
LSVDADQLTWMEVLDCGAAATPAGIEGAVVSAAPDGGGAGGVAGRRLVGCGLARSTAVTVKL